jgi:hypothetical protein
MYILQVHVYFLQLLYVFSGYFANPSGPDGQQFTSLGGQGTSIISSISSERQQAAKDFLKWFGSEPVQAKWAEAGGLSVNSNVMNSDEFLGLKPFHPAYADSMPIVKDFWNVPEYLDLLSVSQTELYKFVVQGEGTALDTAVAIAVQQDRILRSGTNSGGGDGEGKNTTGIIVGSIVAGLFGCVLLFMIYRMNKLNKSLNAQLKEMEKRGEQAPRISTRQRLTASVTMSNNISSIIEKAKQSEE